LRQEARHGLLMGAPLWWTRPIAPMAGRLRGAHQELGRLGLVQRNNGALAFRQEMPEPEDRAIPVLGISASPRWRAARESALNPLGDGFRHFPLRVST
jgi:hypothetical protein